MADQDEDVWEERSRIRDGGAGRESVVVNELTRSFGSKIAVNKVGRLAWMSSFRCISRSRPQVSFGIPQGECFGLLGINGAGKTTLFRMLTGELGMSGGAAAVGGADIASDLVTARKHMGVSYPCPSAVSNFTRSAIDHCLTFLHIPSQYTPQYDGLIPFLTGRDHLVMFARLRGIPRDHIADEVNRTIATTDLQKHADFLAGTYSGGNKRKLR